MLHYNIARVLTAAYSCIIAAVRAGLGVGGVGAAGKSVLIPSAQHVGDVDRSCSGSKAGCGRTFNHKVNAIIVELFKQAVLPG